MVWDYDIRTLKKSPLGKLLLLERLVNYGIYRKDQQKIKLMEVKKNWHQLKLDSDRKRLFRFLIWNR